MLWSNKGLLAILWKLFPNHPNLLPAYFDHEHGLQDFVRKPLLSREGANINIRFGGQTVQTDGPYGAGPFVYQAVAPGWRPHTQIPVFGSWYVTDQGPAGIGIREGKDITDNLSRFVLTTLSEPCRRYFPPRTFHPIWRKMPCHVSISPAFKPRRRTKRRSLSCVDSAVRSLT